MHHLTTNPFSGQHKAIHFTDVIKLHRSGQGRALAVIICYSRPSVVLDICLEQKGVGIESVRV